DVSCWTLQSSPTRRSSDLGASSGKSEPRRRARAPQGSLTQRTPLHPGELRWHTTKSTGRAEVLRQSQNPEPRRAQSRSGRTRRVVATDSVIRPPRTRRAHPLLPLGRNGSVGWRAPRLPHRPTHTAPRTHLRTFPMPSSGCLRSRRKGKGPGEKSEPRKTHPLRKRYVAVLSARTPNFVSVRSASVLERLRKGPTRSLLADCVVIPTCPNPNSFLPWTWFVPRLLSRRDPP